MVDPTPQSFLPVSFVVPAHNEAKYLETTLNSIHAAARSQDIEYEIIVANDASTDSTKQIALDNGANVVDVELRNIGAVRNAGAAEAKNPLLVFLDADTQLPSETLKETLSQLAGGVIGGGAFVDITREKPLPWIKNLLYVGMVTLWQTIGRNAAGCYMFCHKETFEEFGGFDENYFAAEEYFFSHELKKRGKFKVIKSPVITSARKLHGYSTLQLFRFLLRPMLTRKKFLHSRTGLEVLYEDKR